VVLLGIVVLAVALYLFYKAYSAKFQSRLNLTGLSAQMKKLVINLGRFGFAALGVVSSIVAIFLMVAAFQHNAKQAVGLDGALQELARQPFGPFLLGIVALGLIAYGIYSFVEARFRRLGR
jgi:type IV secretory pathway VirB2 component (pilin)